VVPLLLALIAGMRPQAASPGSCWLRDAASTDSGVVFLLCEQGSLFKSRDLMEWEAVRIPASDRLRAIHFLDERHGIVVGDSGLLMVTSDGGKNWEKRPSGTRESLTTVHGAGRKVWAGGHGGVILHSDDAGLTWQLQPAFTTGTIESVYFLDENRGWAVGWAGLLLRTTDGGRFWDSVRLPGVWETLSCVRFRDARNGWAVGMFGAMLRTRDGGSTWQRLDAPVKSWLTSIAFVPGGTAWIAADYQLLRSDDDGETWREVAVEMPAAVIRLLATRNAVLAAGPGFVAAHSGSQSAWGRLDIEEIMRRAARLAPQAAVSAAGGRR